IGGRLQQIRSKNHYANDHSDDRSKQHGTCGYIFDFSCKIGMLMRDKVYQSLNGAVDHLQADDKRNGEKNKAPLDHRYFKKEACSNRNHRHDRLHLQVALLLPRSEDTIYCIKEAPEEC